MEYIHVDKPNEVLGRLPLNWRNVSNLAGLETSEPSALLTLGFRPVTKVNEAFDPETQVRSIASNNVTGTDATITYSVGWKTTEADAIKHNKKKADDLREFSDNKSEVLGKLTSLTDKQLENFIDTNVTSLASAKTYLKRLTKIVRALAKLSGD